VVSTIKEKPNHYVPMWLKNYVINLIELDIDFLISGSRKPTFCFEPHRYIGCFYFENGSYDQRKTQSLCIYVVKKLRDKFD
jgi:hypothetical protein